ncbi:MAG TPA: sulfatase-like hydrolase/transferase [Thermoanaerobaculia bacterium]|nr:sulfatase-like hydrolase/transferase [Thermoanaerobaculia bacterium]
MRRTVLALLVLALVSCKGDRALPAASAATPIFIISIDTLRSDRLPIYGYEGVETPHIDALRADGILYERAYSHTPLTLPSHASLLTGLLPAGHGVRDNIGFQLQPAVPSIAEVLQRRGYATGAAVSAFVLRRESGLSRGFDLYDDSVEALPNQVRLISNLQRDGAATAAVAKEWIAKQRKPVFFLLHLYEPHTPYTPPEPYKSRYASAYDGEIARSDEIVGDFLQSLKDSGLYDRSLIILLSDHGEGLNDHGEEEHGMFLYREAIQVPLVVKLPEQRFAGETVSPAVQLIDVVPTIVDRTGIAAPAGLGGRSLLAFLGEKSPERRSVYSETYYPRFHFGWADQHSIIDGERHYIHSPKPELYDLRTDFAEKKNIMADDRRGYFAMRAAIAPLIRKAEAPSAVDPEEAAKLAALGYLGSTVQTGADEVLPDPKDHIPTFKDIGDAFVLFGARKYDESLKLCDRLLAENPRILDLYDLKTKVLARLGRIEEAIETGKAGLRLSPNATHIALDVANHLLESGKLDDAEKHAELALKSHPGRAHDLLARIAIERKDLAQALREAMLAVQTDSDRIASAMTLARVRREQGQLQDALKLLDDAIQKKKPQQEIGGLYFLRGDVYARLGSAEEAERDLRREIELFPDDPLAYKNLVLLLVAQGRIPEGTQLIRQLIAKSPTPPSYMAVCHVLDTLGDARGVRYWARQGLARYPEHSGLRRLAG